MKIKPIRMGNQLGHRRLAQEMTPPSFVRTAHDNVPDPVPASEIEKRFDRLFRTEAHHLSAKVPRSLLVIQKITLQRGVDAVARLAFGLDVNHKPVCV